MEVLPEEKTPLYVVLEGAPLKTAQIGKEVVLLSQEDHATYIQKKLNADPSLFRPDITHQCLLTLLDSPLNKSGRLRVFVHTADNVLISVDPSCKIPRTYKRFAGLMVQLLQKLKIRAVNESKILLRVIKNPVTDHLPVDAIKVGTSTKGELVSMAKFAKGLPPKKPVCFVVGAVSKGNPGMECGYVSDTIKISNFSLSASNCLFKILSVYEDLWDVEKFNSGGQAQVAESK